MKFCSKCGSQNNDEVVFCNNCGERFDNAAQNQPPQFQQPQQNQQYDYNATPYIGVTRSPITVILLSLVTCGIYSFYLYYTMMNDLNKALNKEVLKPGLYLLLSIFCCPVIFLILYKLDLGLVELSQNEGTPYKSNFMLWIILTFVTGIGGYMALYNLTEGFNAVWAKRSAAYGINPNQGPGPNAY